MLFSTHFIPKATTIIESCDNQKDEADVCDGGGL